MKHMKRSAFGHAVNFATMHPECVDSMERLFESPLKFRGGRGVHLEEDAALEILISKSSEARGLELRMSQLLHRHQRWATTSILSCHSQLKTDKSPAASHPECVL